MDAHRFDAIARAVIAETSRRRALGVFLGGVLGLTSLLSHEQAEAKSCRKACEKKKDCKKKNDRKARKKCKKQCKKSCKDQGGFCAGKNSCQAGNPITPCHRPGAAQECFCVVTDTGAPFCANQEGSTDCSTNPCAPGETCINTNGGNCAGGFICTRPCSEPL